MRSYSNNEPEKKIVYCKKCGGIIDSETKKCNKCGKQYFKIRFPHGKLAFSITFVTALLSICLNVAQHCFYQSEITAANDSINALTIDLRSKDKQITAKDRELSLKDDEIAELEEYNELYWTEHYFFFQHAVIVQSDGTTLCHKYGCTYLDANKYDFLICSSAVATAQGFTQCTECSRKSFDDIMHEH